MRKLVVLLFFVAVFSGNAYLADSEVTQKNDRIVARIDGDPIMMSEVEEKVEGLTGKFKEINPEMKFPEERLQKMRKDFLDRLIREKILEKAANKENIQITDQEVQQKIEQFYKFFGEGEAAKQRFLSGIKDMDKFKKQVAKQIRVDAFMDRQIANQVKITDEDVKKYYDEHSDRFVEKEKIKASQIFWKLPDKEDASFEKLHKQSMSEAEEVIKEAQSGKEFKLLSEKYNKNEKLKASAGEMDWVTRGMLAKDLEDTLFNMQPGEISRPVESTSGIYVFKVNVREDAKKQRFDEAKEKIKTILEGQTKRDLREKLYQDLRNKTKVEITL